MKKAHTIDLRNLYRREDIRAELQILRKRILARVEAHLEKETARLRNPELFTLMHLPTACHVCHHLEGQKRAIEETIKLFGGRAPTERTRKPSERSEEQP